MIEISTLYGNEETQFRRKSSIGITPVIAGWSRRSKSVIPDIAPYLVGIIPVNTLKDILIISAGMQAPRGDRRRQEDKDLQECKLANTGGRGPANRLFEIERNSEAKGTMHKMRSRLI